MMKQSSLYEPYLLSQLNKGDKEVYTYLFNLYYKDLVLFAGNYLDQLDACEDIVQATFLKLWEEHDSVRIETSLKAYLLNNIKNRCIDFIRHQHVKDNYRSYVTGFSDMEDYDTENYVLYSNLKEHLSEALAKLPEQYREAFMLNRMSGLKYKEIAEKLAVSERTVEVRIGKALGLLRVYLKDFLTIAIIVLMNDF